MCILVLFYIHSSDQSPVAKQNHLASTSLFQTKEEDAAMQYLLANGVTQQEIEEYHRMSK